MKTLFITYTMCCLFSIGLSAQHRISDNIDYSPFIGTWIYESNDTIFKIDLKPIHEKNKFLFYGQDNLYGGYSIRIGGILKTSCFNEYPDTLYDTEIDRYNIGIKAFQNGNIEKLIPGMLYTHFFDKERKHNYHGLGLTGNIYLLSSDEILWTLADESEWAAKLEVPFEDKGYSVPTYAILKKIENKKIDEQLVNKYKSKRLKKVRTMPKVEYPIELDSLIGTWRYENNDTIFRITLKKELYNSSHWMLIGNYELHPSPTNNGLNSRGGNEIQIYARNYRNSQKGILHLVFRDCIKKHNYGVGLNRGKIRIISSNKIHWDLRQEKHEKVTYEYSVPINVIMTKEK